MQNKLKLLFIIPSIEKAGGVEKVVAQLTDYLQQKGNYKVTILNCLPLTEKTFYAINGAVELKSLNRNHYPANASARILWYFQLVKPLQTFLINHKFDLVFAEGGYIAASLSLCKTNTLIKVGCEHVSYNSVNYLHRFLRKILFGRLDAIIVLTDEDKKYYQRSLKTVYRIPNFIESIPDEMANHQIQTIVACGRLELQKGFDLLMDAFKIVHQEYPAWKLIIYGEGSKRKELEVQRKALHLENCIVFAGETTAISSHLKNASIFVLSSRFEGFSLVLLEAMSLGLCCVSFNINGMKEIISDGVNGSLVQPEDVKDLGARLCSLISKKDNRENFGVNARETAHDYQLSKIGLQWIALIEHLKIKVNAV